MFSGLLEIELRVTPQNQITDLGFSIKIILFLARMFHEGIGKA